MAGIGRTAGTPFDNSNIKVCALGDSLTEHNNFNQSNFGSWARGPITWLKTLDNRFLFEVWPDAADPNGRSFTGANHGVGGQDDLQIAARVGAVIAMRPRLCIVCAGSNSMSGARTADEIASNILTNIVDRLLAAGIDVVLMEIPVRGTASWASASAARRKNANVNRQLEAGVRRRANCYWFSANGVWAERTSAINAALPRTNYVVADAVHFTPQGGYFVGRALLALLQSIYPGRPNEIISSADDIYDATENPFGWMTSATPANNNPFLLGSVAVADTGGSGFKATGTVLERLTGTTLTVAGSKNADGSQRIAITPAASAIETATFRFGDFAHGQPVGAWVQAAAFVGVEAWTGWKGISLLCRDTGASGISSYGLQSHDPAGDDTGLFPQEAWSGWLVTEPFQIVNTGNLRVRLEFMTKGGVAGTGNANITAMAARRVQDPRPTWNVA